MLSVSRLLTRCRRQLAQTVSAPDGRLFSGQFDAGGNCDDGVLKMPDGTSIFGAFRDWSPHGKCRLVGGAVPEGPSQVFVLFREGVADKALANFSSGAAMTWINESRRPVLRQDDPMNAAAHADAGMFVISYPDGSSFEGAVMRGRPVGGTVTMPLDEDGKALAAKSFAKRDSVVAAGALGPAGTLEGPGTFVNLEGCVFRGVWSHGTLTNGRLEYIDGSIYDGDFDDDGVPHGAGSYALPNGADKWVGEFKKGMFVKGHLADKDGNVKEHVSSSAGEDILAKVMASVDRKREMLDVLAAYPGAGVTRLTGTPLTRHAGTHIEAPEEEEEAK